MKKIKCMVSVMLMLCMLLSFIACGQDEYKTIEVQQQTQQIQTEQSNICDLLTIGVTDDVGRLHPLFVSSTQMVSLNHLIYDGLFEMDSTGAAQHCLAKDYSYRANADGTVTWILELAQNVPWHGGLGTMSADDAVYTIETILAGGGFYAENVAGITSVTARGTDKLVIVTDRYYPDMPEKLTFPIIPKQYYAGKEGLDPMPMGCGAYAVADMNTADGTWLLLESFDERWRQPAKIGEVHVKLYHDSSTLVKAYQQQEVQVALTNEQVTGQALGAGHGTLYPVCTNQLEILVPNTAHLPLNDVRVRQAIGYAINKNDIMTLLYAKRAVDVDLPVATGHFLESAQSHRYDYDVQTARALLAEAGFYDLNGDGFLEAKQGGGPLTLRLITNDVQNNTLRRQTANLIAEALAQVGIKVEVETVAFDQIEEVLQSGNYDLVLTGIVTPHAPQSEFLYSEALNGYQSPQLDAALQAIGDASDRETWLQANEDMQQLMLDEYFVMPLFYRCSVLIAQENIEGVDPCGELQAFYQLDQWQVLAPQAE